MEGDFISSMIEIPRSRPRNADRTKHGERERTRGGGRDRSNIEPQLRATHRGSAGLALRRGSHPESDALRVWADVSGNPITAANADGRTDGRMNGKKRKMRSGSGSTTRRLKPRKAADYYGDLKRGVVASPTSFIIAKGYKSPAPHPLNGTNIHRVTHPRKAGATVKLKSFAQ